MRLACRAALLTMLALGVSCAGRCGARGGLPPARPPLVRGPDGQLHHLVDRGRYKAYYDRWGRLERLEHDENGDGRPDQVAFYSGSRIPRRIEIDQDFDGTADRWEEYDAAGTLVRVGASTLHPGRPDVWLTLDTRGQALRKEYDANGDGRIERTEILSGGRMTRLELDTDGDGRPDRWQDWRDGRATAEEIDTDGDGRPDRRLRYDRQGHVVDLDRIATR